MAGNRSMTGERMTGERDRICGRLMRLPLFDGQVADRGPVHLVSQAGDEYLLVAEDSSTPGPVEALAARSAAHYEAYLDHDVTVRGDIYGSVIWRARVEA